MGIGTLGGVTESAVKRALEGLESVEFGPISYEGDSLNLGDENRGIILHTESGETLEGVSVNETYWVEIYGAEIHFSEV